MFSCENDFHGGFPQTAADALYPVTAPSPKRPLLSARAFHVLLNRQVSQPHNCRSKPFSGLQLGDWEIILYMAVSNIQHFSCFNLVL